MRGTRAGVRGGALFAAVIALFASILVGTAPTAAAATVLDSTTETCLRGAAGDAGGVLVFLDTRMSAYEASRIAYQMRGGGRPTCVHREARLTVGRAFAWWAGLPANRRPGVVVLAVSGTLAQVSRWSSLMPSRRLLGTADSLLPPAKQITLWKRGITGVAAGRAILGKLGELMVNAHSFSGAGALKASSAAQCAAAAASPRGVLVLGDSITFRDFAGAEAGLKARGWVPCIYAQSSSRIIEHLARIRAGRVPLPPNVVVALGNNDLFTANGMPYHFRLQAKALLRALHGRNVVFPTVWRTKNQTFLRAMQHNCRSVNNILRDLGRGRADMRVPDWGAVIRANPALQYDGIHLTSTGLRLRYDMFDAALESMQPAPEPSPAP